MAKTPRDELDFDERHTSRPQVSDFDGVAARLSSRRAFLGSAAMLGASAFVLSAGPLAPRSVSAASKRLSFGPVAANSLDTVTVPNGYSWTKLISWGDPLWSNGVPFDQSTRGTGASQALACGDNNDGMSMFAHGDKSILVFNNEYVNRGLIYGNRKSQRPEIVDDVRKGKAGHGVTVVEIAQQNGNWAPVIDSSFNRRITADTPMQITGPARGHDALKTAADPSATQSLGTWNNCANGQTPWGTYLACEENFNGYFSSSDENYPLSAEMLRYGVGHTDWGYAWALVDERFDISKHPNECNRAGFVVEIDPLDPTSTPKKRTALGRFKHENAEVVIADNGHVVAYLGDDERGEYLYRFVSENKYMPGGDNTDLLENGDLFVAKFSDDGNGAWIALTPDSTGMKSKADIAVFTRIAASAVGGTTMDRPEWVASSPTKAEVYCALSNNKNRGKSPNAGGDETPVGGPNPRASNIYGQIVRWWPTAADHTAAEFEWDLYVMAGNPTVHKDERAGSNNITAENTFNSPDGIKFDSQENLWIQTDGRYSNKGDFANQGNNQMLVGDTESGEIRRFLVGPKECEVTGLTWSADKRTMFVGIQHPGGQGGGHFPDGGDLVARSTIIAVSKDDGSIIG